MGLEFPKSGIVFFKWYYYFVVISIYKIISIAVGLVDNCFRKECDPLLQASLTTISKKSTKG